MPKTVLAAVIASVFVLDGCASVGRVYKAGGDVTSPELVRSVRPSYTQSALMERIEGEVLLEGDVQVDGRVRNIKVVRSLDTVHGLDEAAAQTLSQWQFKPGMRHGRPVIVCPSNSRIVSPSDLRRGRRST